MRLLLVSPYFPPEVGSAAHLYWELARALEARGHEVTVLTGLPRYHVVGDKSALRRRPLVWQRLQGLRVLRVFNLDIPWDRPIFRGIDQLVSACLCGLAGMALPAFEAALVYSPPLPLALATLALGRLRGRPVLANIQDLFPQSAVDLGLLTNPLAIRAFRQMEALLYSQVDGLICHSEGNRRYIQQAGGHPEKITVIPNWIDTEALAPGSRDTALRRRLGLEGQFVVSFAGIMGYSQDLETVLGCAALLQDHPGIVFLLVGDGVEKPRLEALAAAEGLRNVRFLPMQPQENYGEVLATSDLCLATLRREVLTPVVPSKILSIMAAGRPVLAALPLTGDAPALIRKAGCGVCVPPGEPAAMARAILDFYADPTLGRDLGARGRAFAVRHLSLAVCRKTLEELFLKAVHSAASA